MFVFDLVDRLPINRAPSSQNPQKRAPLRHVFCRARWTDLIDDQTDLSIHGYNHSGLILGLKTTDLVGYLTLPEKHQQIGRSTDPLGGRHKISIALC